MPSDGVTQPDTSVYEAVQGAKAEDLMDEAIKRIASRFDPTDTDEGMEALQTALSEAVLGAIGRTLMGWSR